MPDAGPVFLDEHHLRIGDVDFHCGFPLDDVPANRLPMMKPRAMVEQYIEFCAAEAPRTILELGIRHGGSTALLAELTDPAKLVAVELDPGPLPRLAAYLEARGRTASVRPYFGVDQADRSRLGDILETEFADQPVDLVIDDASHLLTPTRASFEVVFPRVRDGGWYVIEDWGWEHLQSDRIAAHLDERSPEHRAAIAERLAVGDERRPPLPLTVLVIELMLAQAARTEIVVEIRIDRHWVAIRRGPAAVDRSRFRVSDLYQDHFGLVPHEPGPP